MPYRFFCCLSEGLFQDTSPALGTGPAVRGPDNLVGISGFPSHPSYGRPRILALSQADLFRGKLILLQKANAKINPCLLESGEVAGKRTLYKCMLLIPCYNQPPPTPITTAQSWEQPPGWAVPSRRKCTALWVVFPKAMSVGSPLLWKWGCFRSRGKRGREEKKSALLKVFF